MVAHCVVARYELSLAISKVSFDLKYLEKGLFAFKRSQRQLRQYRRDFGKKNVDLDQLYMLKKPSFFLKRTFKDFKRNDTLLMLYGGCTMSHTM